MAAGKTDQQKKGDTKKPAYEKFNDQVSYAIGMDIGNSFKKQSLDLNLAVLMQGVKDVLAGKTPAMSEDEVNAVMMEFQTQMRQKASARGSKESEEFLSKNKQKAGVVTLPSGLQYKVVTAGTGAKPKLTDSVSVHYQGTLIGGKEFDSSYKRGEPANFPLQGVIAGWTEILQLMPVGSKWEVYIPSALAYGERGNSGIPPNSTLIFTIELLNIEQSAK